MADNSWFLVDDFGYMVGACAQYISYGLGLGGILWALGLGVDLIFRFVRY